MKAVGLDEPLFVRRGEGAYVKTADGGRYVDWVMSFGPLIFGHADRETVEAVQQTADEGTTFGATTEREVELAAEIVDAFPSIEQVRLVSSGTEAAMSAIRLARGATRRDRILKFAGCYHGHADALLAEAGSGPATLGVPATAGVPTVAGNMGVIPPEPWFLEALRQLCDASGALLVFDEVITGFRIARGGAQERLGVRADLTVLGKIVGGGMPIGAFGGSAEVMSRLAPVGDVYQAGTLSGNPLATAAGISVLRRLRDPAVYEELERKAARLEAGLSELALVQRVGAMATLFVGSDPDESGVASVTNFSQASACDTERYGAYFRHMLERGIYVPPSQFEAMFVSLAHGDEEIDKTVEAAAGFFAK